MLEVFKGEIFSIQFDSVVDCTCLKMFKFTDVQERGGSFIVIEQSQY